MRKGTVRDMKKNVLLRGLFGIPTGIAIGYVITVMMSAFWGDGSYYPCVPAFVDAMGSEIRAVVVQTVLCGLVGMVYAAGSVVWEVDRWSLAGQTAAYFLITLARCFRWRMRHTGWSAASRRAWLHRNLLVRSSLEPGFSSILDGAQKINRINKKIALDK